MEQTPSPYAGVRNSGPAAQGIRGKGAHIGTIKSLGLVHDLQDYIVSMETLALEQRRELDRVKEEKKDLEKVVHKAEMHAEKPGLNTEWVLSTDLPPRLRSIVEDNKALKDKLRKYRLNNTSLEALMLQKEARLLVIADTNVRLRTQLLECARTVEDVDQEVYLKQQITDRDKQIKALHHQLRVAKQKTDTDAKTFRYNLAFAAREKQVIKRQVVQAGVELEEKDRAYRTALLEIRSLRRRLVPGRHAASNAFDHWGEDGEDAMQMEGDALDSSHDEAAFQRSTTDNELFPLLEAEPSLRDPAYEPTQPHSNPSPPISPRHEPPNLPAPLSGVSLPTPAARDPTDQEAMTHLGGDSAPGAESEPASPLHPDSQSDPLDINQRVALPSDASLAGVVYAQTAAGMDGQGPEQGLMQDGVGEVLPEEGVGLGGVAGGEVLSGTERVAAAVGDTVFAVALPWISVCDAELEELQLKQEAAVIKIQASAQSLIARHRASAEQGQGSEQDDTPVPNEGTDASIAQPAETAVAVQDGTQPDLPAIPVSPLEPPLAPDAAAADLHTHLSPPQAVPFVRRPFNTTAKVIRKEKPNGTPEIALPARTPAALQPKKSLQALISPDGAKAAGRKC
ncbi:MAG: hypothetical protein WDW38_002787 [Sanguina aurantia]